MSEWDSGFRRGREAERKRIIEELRERNADELDGTVPAGVLHTAADFIESLGTMPNPNGPPGETDNLREDDQAAVDRAARKLRELGYDVGDRAVVPEVGVTPNLRAAVALAFQAARDSHDRDCDATDWPGSPPCTCRRRDDLAVAPTEAGLHGEGE